MHAARFPSLLVLLSALAAGCDSYAEADDVEDTDADTNPGGAFTDANDDGVSEVEVAVAQCSETYTIPGPFGTVLDSAVEPHANTFGASQEIVPGTPSRGIVGPTPSHVHISWPGEDTSNSIGFVWTTDTGTLASQVQIAEGDNLDPSALTTTFDGITYRYGGVSGDAYRLHELKLCGRLKPSTTYSYRVGGEGNWSPVFSFTTPGAPGSFDSFVAVFVGDSRGGYEEWGQLVDLMEAESPDLYLFSGDAVELGSNQFEWHAWWEASGDVFAEKVLMPAHGNHEALAANYFAQFSLPGVEEWYSFRYGNLAVASLNDTPALGVGSMQFDQVSFLEDNLDIASEWKLAMHHRPTYSVCSRHGSDEELRGYWEPSFEGLGFDIVLSGHNHIYERSASIKAGEARSLGDGTVYMVSGGAGAELYTQTETDWFNEVANPILHYVVAEFDSTGVQLTTKSLNGDVIDSAFIPKD